MKSRNKRGNKVVKHKNLQALAVVSMMALGSLTGCATNSVSKTTSYK